MIAALRSSRDLRLLIGGEVISRAGTAASFIAVWAVAVYEMKLGPGPLSILMVCNTLPRIAGSAIAGRLVDRHDPRRVLVVANLLGAAGSVLQWLSPGPVELGLATLVAGASFGAFLPAISSMAPRVVEDRHLLPTNAMLEVTWQLGFVIGPAIGAALIGVAGVRAPLLGDAVSFLVAIGFLVPLRLLPVAPHEEEPTDAGEPKRRLAGLRYVLSVPITRFIFFANTGQWIGIAFFIVLEPLYVAQVLGAGAAALGYLQTAFGAGAITGSWIASRSEHRATPAALGGVLILCGASMVTYTATRNILVAAIGVGLWGVGMGLFMPVSRTLVQRGVPGSRHGLVNGVMASAQGTGEVIPVLAAGQLAALVGVQPTLIGAGLGTVALGVWGIGVSRSVGAGVPSSGERAVYLASAGKPATASGGDPNPAG